MNSHSFGRTLASLVVAAATTLGAAPLLAAQGGAVMVTSQSAMMSHMIGLPISDDAVRSMLVAHVGSILQPGAEDNYVVLVVDANGQYVSSRTSKMTTITSTDDATGMHMVVGSDSAAAGAVFVRTMASASGAAGGTGTGGVITMSRTVNGDEHSTGVMGTGVAMEDVATMGLKRYPAGDITDALLIVSVVKLK